MVSPLFLIFPLCICNQKTSTMKKNFINGFPSWMESFFEITSVIAIELEKNKTDSKIIAERYEVQGSCGMYELAEELTDKFENLHKGRDWDGEWIDTIDEFVKKELEL